MTGEVLIGLARCHDRLIEAGGALATVADMAAVDSFVRGRYLERATDCRDLAQQIAFKIDPDSVPMVGPVEVCHDGRTYGQLVDEIAELVRCAERDVDTVALRCRDLIDPVDLGRIAGWSYTIGQLIERTFVDRGALWADRVYAAGAHA
jgi:hypothetical protein